jgi:hypothetical protein
VSITDGFVFVVTDVLTTTTVEVMGFGVTVLTGTEFLYVMLSFGNFFVEVMVDVGIAPFFFDFW